jgi:hypothetical protein
MLVCLKTTIPIDTYLRDAPMAIPMASGTGELAIIAKRGKAENSDVPESGRFVARA